MLAAVLLFRLPLLTAALLLLTLAAPGRSAELAFAEQELATKLTVGYAVRLIDMNADGRVDLVRIGIEGGESSETWINNGSAFVSTPAWRVPANRSAQSSR